MIHPFSIFLPVSPYLSSPLAPAGVWLNSNMRSLTHPKLKPYDIVQTKSGFRIGLLGFLLDDPKEFRDGTFKGHKMEPIVDTARELVKHLKEVENVDFVIPLTHQVNQIPPCFLIPPYDGLMMANMAINPALLAKSMLRTNAHSFPHRASRSTSSWPKRDLVFQSF